MTGRARASTERRSPLRAAARTGAIIGGTLVYIALIGALQEFSDRYIVAGVKVGFAANPVLRISVSMVVWYGLTALAGFLVERSSTRPIRRGVGYGGVAGSTAGAFLAALVLLGQAVHLRAMFVNATPALWELLTFGRGPAGLLILLAGSAALGAAGAAFARIPEEPRRALALGGVLVLGTGTMQELLRNLLGSTSHLYRRMFTTNGLTVAAAVALFALTVAAYFAARAARPAVARRVDAMPARQRTRWDAGWRYGALAVGFFVLLALPMATGNYASDVFDTVGIYILMGLGLNIVVGYAGLLDLGYVAFYAIGAYTVSVLTSTSGSFAMSFWVALPIAVGAGVLAGVLLGIPVLKTHGDYLAIITLGFGEIIRILAISDWLKPYIGGAQGIKEVPHALEIGRFAIPGLGIVVAPSVQQESYYPILLACAVFTYVAWRLRQSRYGRAWMAVREDEHVAEALGVNLVGTKLFAFATGAAMAASAGAMFASKLGTTYPTSFNLLVSINVLVMIIVGGMGSIPGVYVGALALVGLPEVLREFQDYRMLLYGALLVVMMLYRPEGLWPSTHAKREFRDDHGHGRGSKEPAAETAPVTGGPAGATPPAAAQGVPQAPSA